MAMPFLMERIVLFSTSNPDFYLLTVAFYPSEKVDSPDILFASSFEMLSLDWNKGKVTCNPRLGDQCGLVAWMVSVSYQHIWRKKTTRRN